jgi:hypothetical protein
VKVLLDAADLQREPYKLSRHAAYSLLREIGVRVTPRRLVVLEARLLEHLGGGDRVDHNGAGNGDRPPTGVTSRA